MIENLFTSLYSIMTQSFTLALCASLIWGILSILLSPCHLSSIPLVIGFIMRQEKRTTRRAFVLATVFSLGILISIALIGGITASLGRLMGDVGRIGNVLVAIIFLIVGLYLLDVVRLNWSFGTRSIKQKGLNAAFLLGLIFGVALGPCTFAYIAPVLGLAFTRAQTDFIGAVLLVFMFAIGHCAVIVFFGTLAHRVQTYLSWNDKTQALIWIKRICGLLVIFGGIYLLIK